MSKKKELFGELKQNNRSLALYIINKCFQKKSSGIIPGRLKKLPIRETNLLTKINLSRF